MAALVPQFVGFSCCTFSDPLQAEDMVQCPVNPGHMIPVRSSEQHIEYCTLKNKGYTKEELVCVTLLFYVLKRGFLLCACQ